MAYLVIGLAFLAGFLLVFGVNLSMADVMEARRQHVRTRLEAELRSRQREKARAALVDKGVYETAAERLDELRLQPGLGERFSKMVDESGMALRPAHLAGFAVGLALVTGLVVGPLLGHWILAVLAAPAVATVPLLYVVMVRARRRRKLLSQLPEAFDLMARTLRAGQTIPQALQAVADEFSSPVAEEFGYCYDQQDLGLSPEAAMHDLAQRTGLLELKIFVLAVVVQRQTGGNLSELLGKLSSVIRDRSRLRGVVSTLTAEGRLQAVILLALPPLVLVAMLFLNRPYAMILFDYPLLLVGMLVSMAFGALWMYRIVHFDF